MKHPSGATYRHEPKWMDEYKRAEGGKVPQVDDSHGYDNDADHEDNFRHETEEKPENEHASTWRDGSPRASSYEELMNDLSGKD